MGPRVEGNSMEAKEGMMLVTMASDRLADALDKTQWAKGFQWAEIVVIAQVMSVYTVKRDTVLWQEGHAEHYMGILAKGKVDILKSYQQNTGQIITPGKPGLITETSLPQV